MTLRLVGRLMLVRLERFENAPSDIPVIPPFSDMEVRFGHEAHRLPGVFWMFAFRVKCWRLAQLANVEFPRSVTLEGTEALVSEVQ